MGLSFLVPEDSDTLSATVRWADYRPVPIEDDDGKAASVWQREQYEHTEPVSLERAGDYDIADSWAALRSTRRYGPSRHRRNRRNPRRNPVRLHLPGESAQTGRGQP